MAGWSRLSHGPGLECVDNKQCQNNSCFEFDSSMKADFNVCDDLDCVENEQRLNKSCFEIPVKADFDDLDDKKRYFLYRTRSVFLTDVACRNENKPIPPMFGDGRNVDLFKLFWVVRERGGFDVVSKKGMWASVAEELGFRPNGLASGMKLIYIKYLVEIEHWVQKHLKNESSANGKNIDKMRVDCKIEVLNEDTKKVCYDDEKLYENYVHYENDVVLPELSVAKKHLRNESSANGKSIGKMRVDCKMEILNEDTKKVCDDDEKLYDNYVHYENDVVLPELSVAKKHLRNESSANGKSIGKMRVDCKIEILNEDTKKVCDDDKKLYDNYVHYENDIVLPELSVAKKQLRNEGSANGKNIGKMRVDCKIVTLNEDSKKVCDVDEKLYDNYVHCENDIVMPELSVAKKHFRGESWANGKNIEILNEDSKKVCDDDKNLYDNYVHYENDIVRPEFSVAKKDGKRKRESLFKMLKWVMEAAKHPFEYAAGTIPKGSKWKECGSKELGAQALRAREALLLPRHVDSNTHKSLLQNKLRMHPSIYDDSVVSKNHSTERSRCSKRFSNSIKGQLLPKLAPDLEIFLNEEVLETDDLLDQNDSSEENSVEKYTLVGPTYQADIPEWTGKIYESDPKWLGTCIWPLKGKKDNALIELDSVGKGRKDSCNCKLPGSVGCVRFHISEKRMMLKLEFGPAFYHLNFHCIGEEVSLRWTGKEERRFKDMVSLHRPSLDMCFWDSAFKYFPRKKRKNLVSYYFNVFTLRRRSYQNRVNPKTIDSDNDESDFGSFSEGFGHEAVKVPESERLLCIQNGEHIDLE